MSIYVRYCAQIFHREKRHFLCMQFFFLRNACNSLDLNDRDQHLISMMIENIACWGVDSCGVLCTLLRKCINTVALSTFPHFTLHFRFFFSTRNFIFWIYWSRLYLTLLHTKDGIFHLCLNWAREIHTLFFTCKLPIKSCEHFFVDSIPVRNGIPKKFPLPTFCPFWFDKMS